MLYLKFENYNISILNTYGQYTAHTVQPNCIYTPITQIFSPQLNIQATHTHIPTPPKHSYLITPTCPKTCHKHTPNLIPHTHTLTPTPFHKHTKSFNIYLHLH